MKKKMRWNPLLIWKNSEACLKILFCFFSIFTIRISRVSFRILEMRPNFAILTMLMLPRFESSSSKMKSNGMMATKSRRNQPFRYYFAINALSSIILKSSLQNAEKNTTIISNPNMISITMWSNQPAVNPSLFLVTFEKATLIGVKTLITSKVRETIRSHNILFLSSGYSRKLFFYVLIRIRTQFLLFRLLQKLNGLPLTVLSSMQSCIVAFFYGSYLAPLPDPSNVFSPFLVPPNSSSDNDSSSDEFSRFICFIYPFIVSIRRIKLLLLTLTLLLRFFVIDCCSRLEVLSSSSYLSPPSRIYI